MTKRMLIDASHPEETRVVVLNDNQLEDFDFESSTKKQLKGNIYLAKVTRVEPSLQAAFVDYGGQRHGFLAFSEIHPDYYQIPQADRRLLEQRSQLEVEQPEPESVVEEGAGEDAPVAVSNDPDEEAAEVFDEQARRRSRLLRSYKIQEVIKRRQILLVQVVKEERGNKGAALTTYLSLAGRYSVLMPNTARGGGISRKIANPADRARLKEIAREIDVPEGMGLIIRTAGQQRSKLEIRRDYEYSLRLWNDIRERTLQSIAPCMIHEEGALVKRAIRDLYSRDIDEVWVEGEEAYRTAKKVMSMLTPSRARRVKLYKDELPLFHRYGVEEQLDGLHNPVIQLKSGASIVIHTTEALTAIDVNSGRSTRERNIEETALKTNLEAAAEVARQLRLRDIAGLVVVDFIDMAEMRNQRAVERKLREHLKSDRARVQLGRISPFGLLELSRQRLRPSFQELSTQPCPTCHGLGSVRSVESAALQVLRAIELEGMKGQAAALTATLPLSVALYIVNQKRDRLVGLERRYGMAVEIAVDRELIAGIYRLETVEAKSEVEAPEVPVAAQPEAPAAEVVEDETEGGRKRRRRRRRRRRPTDGESEVEATVAAADRPPLAARPVGGADGGPTLEADIDSVEQLAATALEPTTDWAGGLAAATSDLALAEVATELTPAKEAEARPRRRRRRTSPKRTEIEEIAGTVLALTGSQTSLENGAATVEPATRGSIPEDTAEQPLEHAGPDMPAAAVVDADRHSGPPRRGWWSRFVRKED
jgi:ribonuclease E